MPGGIAFGIACGWVMGRLGRWVGGSLGGNLLQFVNAWAIWIVADRLHLSAVLAVVAAAMTIARSPVATQNPRMRVHSFAVWASATFLLNVLAFLLMGMQARLIVTRMPAGRLDEALLFAGAVTAGIVAARFAVVMAWNRLAARFAGLRGGLEAPGVAGGVLVSWAGMRGLVTLATAFALPDGFPQRDLVVLTAFAVVIATLVVQGLTLAPLIRLLGLDRVEDPARELAAGRAALTDAALVRLAGMDGEHANALRTTFAAKRAPDDPEWIAGYREAGLAVVRAQRDALDGLRDDDRVSTATYYGLQEELDWRELTLLPEEERRIEEG